MESTGFGRRHYRPVYVMHKWWARRLGSIFRAILLYSLAETESDQNLWNQYPKEVDFSGKIVLDPMMGGGTTVVEALRFGCNIIAGDLNPVSWFIVKKQVEDIDPDLLRTAMVKLEEELGTELRQYYRTNCPECGGLADGIYYFYHKLLSCPDCATEIPLMRNFFLAKSLVNDSDLVICPQCWDIFETKDAKKNTKCPKCDAKFNPKQTVWTSGRQYFCHNEECKPSRIADWVKRNSMPKERMYAVEFHCTDCGKRKNPRLKNGRGYKFPDDDDFRLFELARKEFSEMDGHLPIPETAIPIGVETRRALNHGYSRFRDMFNERQLLNLGKIYKWILELSDWEIKEFLILAFSNSLKYNNKFAKYNATRGFITDIFRTHSYSPSMAPVEANCYDTPRGRGAFTAFVNLVIEGKEYCRTPFERVYQEDSMVKVQSGKPIVTTLAPSFVEMNQDRRTLLQCGSSEQMNVPDKVADAVITDPPYYGNVMYSELSNFFYVWLRIGLKDRYDWFQEELVPWEEEVIENRVQDKGKSDFLAGLTSVFSESNRILKDDGVFVFTFHHKKEEAWAAVLQAILDSGLFVVAIYPVRSEMKASTHLHDLKNITYDMVIVCRKRSKRPPVKAWSEIKASIKKTTQHLIQVLQENGDQLSQLDRHVIALGKCLEHYSKYYPRVLDDGRPVGIEDALDSIRKLMEH
jgi:adenine-specific DNA methylase